MQLSFGRSALLSPAQKAAISEVSQWALAHLLQSNAFLRREDAQLIVTEVQCNDPDCVPIETFLAVVIDERYRGVLEPLRLTAKLLKPVLEVSEQDVRQLDLRLRFVDERIASAVSLIEDALGERERERERNRESESEGERLAMDLFARFLSAKMRPMTPQALPAIEAEKQRPSSQQSVPEAPPVARAITRVPMRATATPALSLSHTLPPALSPSAETVLSPSPAIDTPQTAIPTMTTPTHAAATSGPKTSAAPTNNTTNTNTNTNTNTKTSASTVTNTAQPSEPLSSSSSSTIPQKRDFREVLQERKRNEEKVSVAARHGKEEKRRGCPCCDPDNLDHLLDKIMFMEYPPV